MSCLCLWVAFWSSLEETFFAKFRVIRLTSQTRKLWCPDRPHVTRVTRLASTKKKEIEKNGNFFYKTRKKHWWGFKGVLTLLHLGDDPFHFWWNVTRSRATIETKNQILSIWKIGKKRKKEKGEGEEKKKKQKRKKKKEKRKKLELKVAIRPSGVLLFLLGEFRLFFHVWVFFWWHTVEAKSLRRVMQVKRKC